MINLVDEPPWVIGSVAFNEAPRGLAIAGVRESNRRLFARLDAIEDPGERGRVFHEYVSVKFALHLWEEYTGSARKALRRSYVRFLNGWGMDSNGTAGAVLKNWVWSRFGVWPTFHRGTLGTGSEEEDDRFAVDRTKGSARTNAIDSQLDLVYQFCQYEIARRWPGETHRTLWRGTNEPEEHPRVGEGNGAGVCVRLNNLVSFTADREKAWEFGSTVWEVEVPLVKVLFFSGLLPESILRGEDEFLVIGGDYQVRELLW